jgi:hypothetical protein
MRDIRGDLQERARLIEREISEIGGQFEQAVERLRAENENRLAELKAELAVIGVLMESEHRRMPSIEPDQAPMPNGPRLIQPEYPRSPNDGQATEPGYQRVPRVLQSAGSPREALADFIARKLAELGPGSQDDLSSVAVQEGYFPDTQHARPSVHATIVDLLRRQRIRQLPDGTLAPATVSQMIRLQQTM